MTRLGAGRSHYLRRRFTGPVYLILDTVSPCDPGCPGSPYPSAPKCQDLQVCTATLGSTRFSVELFDKLKVTHLGEQLFPARFWHYYSFPCLWSVVAMKARIKENKVLFFCCELVNDCIVMAIVLLLCCQSYYVIKAVYLNSQPGYQWPNKGTSLGHAFSCSNLMGSLYRSKRNISVHTSERH